MCHLAWSWIKVGIDHDEYSTDISILPVWPCSELFESGNLAFPLRLQGGGHVAGGEVTHQAWYVALPWRDVPGSLPFMSEPEVPGSSTHRILLIFILTPCPEKDWRQRESTLFGETFWPTITDQQVNFAPPWGIRWFWRTSPLGLGLPVFFVVVVLPFFLALMGTLGDVWGRADRSLCRLGLDSHMVGDTGSVWGSYCI